MIKSKPRTRRAAGTLLLAGASAFGAAPSACAHAHRHASKVAATETEAPFSTQASHDADGSAAYAHDSWHAATLARWGEKFSGAADDGIAPRHATRSRDRAEPGLHVALLAALAGALFALQRRKDH